MHGRKGNEHCQNSHAVGDVVAQATGKLAAQHRVLKHVKHVDRVDRTVQQEKRNCALYHVVRGGKGGNAQYDLARLDGVWMVAGKECLKGAHRDEDRLEVQRLRCNGHGLPLVQLQQQSAKDGEVQVLDGVEVTKLLRGTLLLGDEEARHLANQVLSVGTCPRPSHRNRDDHGRLVQKRCESACKVLGGSDKGPRSICIVFEQAKWTGVVRVVKPFAEKLLDGDMAV